MSTQEYAELAQKVIAAKVDLLCAMAADIDRNLAVGPLELGSEERPTISGHYCKFKVEYRYLYPGERPPLGWVLYHTAHAKRQHRAN
jgi:hypothetical protein